MLGECLHPPNSTFHLRNRDSTIIIHNLRCVQLTHNFKILSMRRSPCILAANIKSSCTNHTHRLQFLRRDIDLQSRSRLRQNFLLFLRRIVEPHVVRAAAAAFALAEPVTLASANSRCSVGRSSYLIGHKRHNGSTFRCVAGP